MSAIKAYKCDTTGKLFEDKVKYTKHIREVAAEAHRRVCIEGNDNMIYVHLLEHFGVEE